ncbi:MAG: MoaD/ThiS family protein [Candidatus Lokiarchaeota archaeon]|nr:MoaD/ThiS family protein [Candidatus Lokiarchaeota archaeon]
MANVKLHLLNIFQLRINKKSIDYEGKTVGDIISQFLKENKDKLDAELLNKNKKKFITHILILLNGRNIKYLKNYKTRLKDGDKLYLSYALAGG